ncbi:hypothetical protein HPT29_028385 (plasmid) [Microvirga terrae]|uniref:Transposase n=1 Tax=Microvirga terrae TaxID=2740529 RepID=A0ABY5S3E2_9HYPH|nr:hypothetical protein [Microvirga terrae]UVF22872.1 hypothetical protein HPT29_028385 [Microvirga terrae]
MLGSSSGLEDGERNATPLEVRSDAGIRAVALAVEVQGLLVTLEVSQEGGLGDQHNAADAPADAMTLDPHTDGYNTDARDKRCFAGRNRLRAVKGN